MKALIERTHMMRAVLDGKPTDRLDIELYDPIKATHAAQQIGIVAADYLENYTETENRRTLSQKKARLGVRWSCFPAQFSGLAKAYPGY